MPIAALEPREKAFYRNRQAFVAGKPHQLLQNDRFLVGELHEWVFRESADGGSLKCVAFFKFEGRASNILLWRAPSRQGRLHCWETRYNIRNNSGAPQFRSGADSLRHFSQIDGNARVAVATVFKMREFMIPIETGVATRTAVIPSFDEKMGTIAKIFNYVNFTTI